MKKSLMSLLSVLTSNSAIPAVAQERLDIYVDRGIAAALDEALVDIRMLLLEAQAGADPARPAGITSP